MNAMSFLSRGLLKIDPKINFFEEKRIDEKIQSNFQDGRLKIIQIIPFQGLDKILYQILMIKKYLKKINWYLKYLMNMKHKHHQLVQNNLIKTFFKCFAIFWRIDCKALLRL